MRRLLSYLAIGLVILLALLTCLAIAALISPAPI